jgi:mannose-1-phosphate guanylyltransferase
MNSESVGRRWTVVLAGGEGARMRPFVTEWLGSHRPKQYCAFTGERTMLEHSLDRALDAAEGENVVTVIGRGHTAYLDQPRPIPIRGRLIEQPENKDTAPGLLLGLAHIMASDPDAFVAVMPSDHFIYPRHRFAMNMDRAFALARRLGDRIVLLSAPASGPETDYGWIDVGTPVTAAALSAREVVSFHEKPALDAALDLLSRGCQWNTMIMVARASALWSLAGGLQPDLVRRFEAIRLACAAGHERGVRRAVYSDMDALNLSKDLLQKAPDRIVALPLAGVEWCDWGRPERVVATLEKLGREPAFPRNLAYQAAP